MLIAYAVSVYHFKTLVRVRTCLLRTAQCALLSVFKAKKTDFQRESRRLSQAARSHPISVHLSLTLVPGEVSHRLIQ